MLPFPLCVLPLYLRGPNRAKCDAIRIAHPEILRDVKKFFRQRCENPLACPEITGKRHKNILRCWPAMRNIDMRFNIERCKMPAIRTLAGVWLAMRVPGCQIASDMGRAMRATKPSTPLQIPCSEDNLSVREVQGQSKGSCLEDPNLLK